MVQYMRTPITEMTTSNRRSLGGGGDDNGVTATARLRDRDNKMATSVRTATATTAAKGVPLRDNNSTGGSTFMDSCPTSDPAVPPGGSFPIIGSSAQGSKGDGARGGGGSPLVGGGGGGKPSAGRRSVKSALKSFNKNLKGFVNGRTNWRELAIRDAKLPKDAHCRSADVSRAGPDPDKPLFPGVPTAVMDIKRAISDSDLSSRHLPAPLRASARSLKGRKHPEQENQDEFFSVPNLFERYSSKDGESPPRQTGAVALFGVFDGHDGSRCSAFVSRHLPANVATSSAWARLRECPQDRSTSLGVAAAGVVDEASLSDAALAYSTTTNVTNRSNDDHTATDGGADIHSSSGRLHGRRNRENSGDGELLPEVMREALLDGFRATDRSFNELATASSKDNSGTTAVVAMVCGPWVVFANLGDSEGLFYNDNYWVGRSEAYIARTKNHNIHNPEEKQRVKAAGGTFENGRLFNSMVPTRGFGDRNIRRLKEGALIAVPEITVQRTQPTTGCSFIVLGSDGLWCLNEAKVIEIVTNEVKNQAAKKTSSANGDKPSKIARLLAEKAERRGNGDDVTAVVVLLG